MPHRRLRATPRTLLAAAGLLPLLLAFAWLNRSGVFSTETARAIIDAAGPFGPLALGVVYAATVVFSPLSGSPLIVAAVAAFGYWEAVITTFVGNLIGSSACFLIARVAGRPAVRRFAGEHSMARLDEIAEIAGLRTLVVLRLFGGGLFDFVSYAAGLTPMRFATYFAITNLCSLPTLLVLVYLFDRAIHMPPLQMGLIGALLVALQVVLPIFIYRRERQTFASRRVSAASVPS